MSPAIYELIIIELADPVLNSLSPPLFSKIGKQRLELIGEKNLRLRKRVKSCVQLEDRRG